MDIAIIGSGCRFPGHANSPSKLWDLLCNPTQLAGPIPPDRFSAQGFFHENTNYHGHTNVKEAYFLAGNNVHRRFDASFFGIHPAEAMCLDPQVRLLLETVYEALEAAGLPMERLTGSDTAVYTGQMVADYNQIIARDNDDNLGTYYASGTSNAMLSNRISYFFDWHGPSMTIDTACSSSLVALHQAVQQLRTGQSRMAVATGANLIIDPKCFISLSKMSVLSPEGRSRMWDAGANGYARGEGIAVILLKTLSAALEDGDQIECIIKETALNQDGKTQGIFSPNYEAQARLIRACYSGAGLDLRNPAHRPHYFECHGTGTLVGDKAEATAMNAAFFPDNGKDNMTSKDIFERLTVGSIKTIVGHTEGTAGLAGIMKVSLSLQHAVITPNLLFENLNPGIRPFYGNMQVSTSLSQWPVHSYDSPRRASVNSFGFGGANVHAILESYDSNNSADGQQEMSPVSIFTPFVFSAHSERSLLLCLENFKTHLQSHRGNISARDLAYTLHSRRTSFQVATAIAASTLDELCDKIDTKLQGASPVGRKRMAVPAPQSKGRMGSSPRILGIFTGQGAQWAGMGSQLLTNSKAVRQKVESMEARLAQLPVKDRPQWSIAEELLKDPEFSRIGDAAISQPLCTAIQILQVDILREAGIEFTAVVGHSSGEIAASYAAGFISADDAICIAYYRGLHANLARGHDGRSGAMMAVGTTEKDAQDLCNDPEFCGRVRVAAVNSPTNVTISGDSDAIRQMEIIFKDENKFVRILPVDKAYHSHHVSSCSAAYLQSLTLLDIEPTQGERSAWFSSVRAENMLGKHNLLKRTYWDDNLVNPVLFKHAIAKANDTIGSFDLAIEVGPHPALQSATLQTMQEISDRVPPYTFLFRRDTSSIISVARGLGYIWTHLGQEAVNLHNYDQFVTGKCPCRLVKDLPTYAWDHGEYWIESRHARAGRLRPGPVHELLGHLTPESNDEDLQWRHILRPSEMPWLLGHRLQGEIVFPAAGYVVTALEAAMALCRVRRLTPSLIELVDFNFERALVFNGDSSSVEVIVFVTEIVTQAPALLTAKFKYHGADSNGDSLNLLATSGIRIFIDEPSMTVLPPRAAKPPNLVKIKTEDFYSASKDLEYQWESPFTPLDKLERKLGAVTGVIYASEPSGLIIHPAVLDGAFQGLILAYTYPDDGQLWGTHVPGRIRRLSVNPSLCMLETSKQEPLPFFSSHHPDTGNMVGNVDVYSSNPSVENAILQVEDLESVPLTRVTAQDDKEAFATVIWGPANPDLQPRDDTLGVSFSEESQQRAELIERIAVFYLRNIDRNVPADHPSRSNGPYKNILRYASEAFCAIKVGNVPFWRPEWDRDTYEQLRSESHRFPDDVAIEFLLRLEQPVSIMDWGETLVSSADYFPISRLYTDMIGIDAQNTSLGLAMKQLIHRYPHLDILQIGAGAGPTTEAILTAIGSTYSSYTFTQSSSSIFEFTKSEPWIIPHMKKMAFRTLTCAGSLVEQGFSEESYDVVVASFALSTFPTAEEMLQTARRLLRSGGHLIILDLLPTRSVVYNLVFNVAPARPDNSSNGQRSLPALSLKQWDNMLRQNGFSGCDSTTGEPHKDNCMTHFAVLASQAMDDKLAFLRHPLSHSSSQLFQPESLIQDLVILGGGSASEMSDLVNETQSLAKPYSNRIRLIPTLSELSSVEISSNTTVLSVLQLDGSVFDELDHEKWKALMDMIMSAGVLVWVTRGRRANNPYAGMMVGLMRSVMMEVPTISFQTYDFEDNVTPSARILTEALLRFQAETLWRQQDKISTSVETELVLDSQGRLMIPRLVVHEEMNDRYNSLRRPLTKHLVHSVHDIHVTPMDTTLGYQMTQGPILDVQQQQTATRLNVTHSVLSAIKLDEATSMFLLLGREKDSNDQIVALSSKNSSLANPLQSLRVKVETQIHQEPAFLSLISIFLLTAATLRGQMAGDIVVVFEPDPMFAKALSKEAQGLGIQVKFLTTRLAESPLFEGIDFVHIHDSCPTRVVAQHLPENISVFVDFAVPTDRKPVRDRISSILTDHCRRESLQTLFKTASSQLRSSRVSSIGQILQRAVVYASLALLEADEMKAFTHHVILPNTLVDGNCVDHPCSIIDWTGCRKIPVAIRPIDTQITFSGQKTYWLAGLSGGLGLALCEWMSRHGARFFVISSRTPKIDHLWLETMNKMGVQVKIASCDVTIKAEVVKLYQEICSTMPPISGVAQGSMVLEDTAIRDMTLDNLLKCTRCKVEGSMHLNELFQEDSLDFFVFFSSVVAVIGRPGQANYGAANMFMSSLAEQRRRKGLAASIIHIGPIYGIGYASQRATAYYTKSAFRSASLIPISERDFYQLFSEAVMAGRHESESKSIELFNGVQRVSRHHQDRPVWEAEPLMSHFLKNSDGLLSVATNSQNRAPLKTLLAETRDRAELRTIIQEAFIPKLYSLYQLDSIKMPAATIVKTRLDEMGTDSLIAVEIRGWFMKSMEVNIPVLKILSGVPVSELVDLASEAVPDRLVPNLVLEQNAGLERNLKKAESLQEDATNVSVTDNAPGTEDIARGQLRDSSISSSEIFETRFLDVESSTETSSEPIAHTPSIQKTFRLSFSQEMFWFVWNFLEDKTSLNHTALARISGEVDIPKLQQAVHSLGEQHEILRTCIITKGDQPVQAVMASSRLRLEVAHIRDETDARKTANSLQDSHVYDIGRGETVRIMLLTLSPREHFLVAGLHPLVADGTSFLSLLKGVQEHYTCPNNTLADRSRQYSFYSERKHLEYAQGMFEKDLRFWRAEFKTPSPPLPILTISSKFSRPSLTTYDNDKASLRVGANTKDQIQSICRDLRTTPFHFYVAVFRVLLLRFAPAGAGSDVVIGIGDANRDSDNVMDVIGPFVNLIPLRIRTEPSAHFADLLQTTRNVAYAALAHSNVPFQVLLAHLEKSRSSSYTSLFQCFVNYRHGMLKEARWGPNDSLGFHSVEIGISKMGYDLTLEVVDYVDGDCLVTLVVRRELYGQAGADRLIASYERLLTAFVEDPTVILEQPDAFHDVDVQQVLKFSQGPRMSPQWPETVAHRIEQVAQARPHEVAVSSSTASKTYLEITAEALAISSMLQDYHVSAGSPVVVLLEPGSAWIASLLGIMRHGAIYVPLDLSLPWARLATIIHDCQPSVLLVDEETIHHVAGIPELEAKVVHLASIERPGRNTPISVSPSDPAAILYTSGSSGIPKGVMLSHDGLRNWAEPLPNLYGIKTEVVLQQTSPSFDLSLVQVLTALCFGGRVCLVPRRQRGDAIAIGKILAEQGVTFTCATPTEYSTWFQYSEHDRISGWASWKIALSAGEPIPISLVKEFSALNSATLTLYNGYGPTEASLTATMTKVPLDTVQEPITAGRPLPNYSLYVLDGQRRPVPVGVQGEIYIGGPGVGLGYLKQQELTAAKFVPNHLIATRGEQMKDLVTMHRTGDLGRWRQDGMLLIEGRIDTQIKLRGLRVDLGEIEHAILKAAGGILREAIVSVRRGLRENEESLIAHVTTDYRDSLEQQISMIKSGLREVLPQHMLPAAILPLDKLPTTTSGKLDRKLIATFPLNLEGSSESFTEANQWPPLTDVEAQLKTIWEHVLGFQRKISAETDFFHVGGSSLLLLKLQRDIREKLEKTLSLIDMFEWSTLGTMAALIDSNAQLKNEAEAIDWIGETAIPSTLLDILTVKPAKPPPNSDNSQVRAVAVTGATGDLGQALLKSLIADPVVEEIHCIAVRNVQTGRLHPTHAANPKVKVYEGDLSHSSLGLTKDDAKAIFSAVDAVIHGGADTSHLKTYTSLRNTNLGSTKSLIEMMVRHGGGRLIPFHYISTISVGNIIPRVIQGDGGARTSIHENKEEVQGLGLEDYIVFRPVSVAEWQPPARNIASSGTTRGSHGYVGTKWACEVFLEQLCKYCPEWPITIHRPSTIISWDHLLSPNSDPDSIRPQGLIDNIVHYVSLLNRIPAPFRRDSSGNPRARVSFNVVPMADVVAGVLKSMRSRISGEGGIWDYQATRGIQFLHHIGDTDVSPHEIQDWVGDKASDRQLQEIPAEEWVKEASELGMQPAMAALVLDLAMADGEVTLPRAVR